MCMYISLSLYIYIYGYAIIYCILHIRHVNYDNTICLTFSLVGASNVGEFLCRCDPLTQTMFVFRC